ncbi:Adaptive-response sensory-kinase SasA [Streptomyces sp. RB5]|uniref:histidine kinase n=1 Tax=Streptomyces smaragdinus TaxID=2585196 RepID=A0A7K0CI17_9ACTN|nr:HAMP domain-containing sensor histidine kinase [Streptomyces smaragdinus]MQY13117.1 Adaptive-response sensory-kinase SasA [Streptomyces smaragdinus]
MTGRLRRLPLRSRLALLTACAVAVAVAVAALACWVITRGQLMDQLDRSLRQAQAPTDPGSFRYGCVGEREDTGLPRGPVGPGMGSVVLEDLTAQWVLPDGTACLTGGEHTIATTETDRGIAAVSGTGPRGDRAGVIHTVDSHGEPWRVYTRPGGLIQSNSPDLDGQPFAISIARPLSEVTDPLTTLAWVLAGVAGAGVLVAGAAGLGIARAGLRPVDRLTGTVEHIAQTEDLSVRIPVAGDDEIARLSRSFNAMTEALASSRDRQQQLIADAGHELRTPLTSLRTNIELLVRSEQTGRPLPPDDRAELLTSVKAQMTELAALIGDLQELSRPDADPHGRPLPVVALHDIAGRAVERARLRGAGIAIGAELTPWYVRGEPAALERALVNLLDNAVKFSPSGGTVDVRLTDGELTVRDHGAGIAPADLPHVFERFWRSPGARSLPGSGLGLSIVARTAQQTGGTVHLAPAKGGGTVAVLRLPGAATPPPDI